MYYKLEGNGETLLFIHGLSDNLVYWEFLAANLRNDFQILRYDLRGHGDSELGRDEIIMDTYVEDLHSLINDLGIDNVNLIGFSLGGAIALGFAVKYPEMVSSLVLMSSFHKADGHVMEILNKFKNALNDSFEEFYNLILPMVLCPDVIDDNMEELELLKQIASQSANTEAYIKAVDVCLDFDVEDELSKITIPTLILSGKYDDISTLELQKEMQSKINDSRLIVFEDTKHNLLVGKNNGEILEILKKEYK
jgi:pimeloyl-ACP methyl ester carboxylesterase